VTPAQISGPKTFGLSLLPSMMNPSIINGAERRRKYPIGRLVENARVVRVETEWGLLCELEDGDRAFVHVCGFGCFQSRPVLVHSSQGYNKRFHAFPMTTLHISTPRLGLFGLALLTVPESSAILLWTTSYSLACSLLRPRPSFSRPTTSRSDSA
jgi:hypothetical protein